MKTLKIIILTLLTIQCFGQNDKNLDKKAIICLTYDDVIESHVNIVLPLVDSLGLKATFFLNSLRGSGTSDFNLTTLPWIKAAKNGHELGNHTLFHACPEKYGFPKELAIESYTLDKLMKEIELTNWYLTAIDGEQKERAFGYPCDNPIVEGVDYSIKLKESKLIRYARISGDKTNIIRDFKSIDLMKVPSWLVDEGTTLSELIAFATEVKNNAKMGIYVFHGIDVPPFKISAEVHKQFLEYLAANQDKYWVTTFSSAMDYVTNRREKK